MKHFKYFLTALLFAATFASCSDTDPNTDPGTDPGTGETTESLPASLGGMLNHFQDKFGLTVKYEFTTSEWEPVSNGEVFSYTAVTDTGKVKELLVYLNDRILSLFPEEVIARYMPPKILLVDSLYNTFTYEDRVNSVSWEKRYTLPGNTTGDYLVLGDVGARLNTSAPDFKASMISLFVDRLLYNQNLPALTEFEDRTKKALTDVGASYSMDIGGKPYLIAINYPYWDGKAGSATRTWMEGGTSEFSGDIYEIKKTQWQGRGILNMGRPGYTGFSQSESMSIVYHYLYYTKGTVRQDFADFAALILTKTPAEREAIFSAVETNLTYSSCSSGTYCVEGNDTRFPYGGATGAQCMRDKVGMVKAYFSNNLGFSLPE